MSEHRNFEAAAKPSVEAPVPLASDEITAVAGGAATAGVQDMLVYLTLSKHHLMHVPIGIDPRSSAL